MTSEEPQSTRSRWSDLDRPPLNEAALRRGLLAPRGPWTSLDVVQVTGSTNSDLAARVRDGSAAEGAVLIAEEQSAGRGRLDRRWSAPPRSGLFFSVVFSPAEVPAARWGWLPLLAGVATASAAARTAGVDTALKWPNDLLVTVDGEERKAGGILTERIGGSVVAGIGLNVTLRAEELPVPAAGSLALAGSPATDRDPLLRVVLRELHTWYTRWRDAEGDPGTSRLQEAYTAGCATLGRRVRAELPGGRQVAGEAVAIDSDGCLVLTADGGERTTVAAGDVVHLRTAE